MAPFLAAPDIEWTWKENHELPRWGQKSTDLASIGQPAKLIYPTLVTKDLACKKCGKRDKVQLVQHHAGGCGAFEWTHGIDIDWRWTCCGKHESFANITQMKGHMHQGNLYKCSPVGNHTTGCVTAPLCTACFVCPCASLIAARNRQMDEM